MQISVGSMADFYKSHAPDCDLQKYPMTVCTAMLWPVDYTPKYTCTCGGFVPTPALKKISKHKRNKYGWLPE